MSKYEVGDKVVVSKYILDDGRTYGVLRVTVAHRMMKFREQVVTIDYVDPDGAYMIAEDANEYWWVDEMFSGLAQPRYKTGDKVHIRADLPPHDCPHEMFELRGMVATITDADLSGYRIEEDDGVFTWDETDFDGLVEKASAICDETKSIKKERNPMKFNLKSMIKQYVPHTINDGSVALSASGDIAYRRENGDYVFYDPESNSVKNCMQVVFGSDELDKMVFVVPAKEVCVGDVVLNNGQYVYITNITIGFINGVSLESGRTTTLVREINALMGCPLYAKVTSLFSMSNGRGSDTINPMLLMLIGSVDDADDLFATIAMMTAMGGNTTTAATTGGLFNGMNPLMLLALSSSEDEGGGSDLMKMLLLGQMMGGGLFQTQATTATE